MVKRQVPHRYCQLPARYPWNPLNQVVLLSQATYPARSRDIFGGTLETSKLCQIEILKNWPLTHNGTTIHKAGKPRQRTIRARLEPIHSTTRAPSQCKLSKSPYRFLSLVLNSESCCQPSLKKQT